MDGQTRMARKKSGFSLVELIVVIAIVSMLVAILLPTLTRARRAADAVNCMSNLRQVANALSTYESIYREFPLLRDPTLGTVMPTSPTQSSQSVNNNAWGNASAVPEASVVALPKTWVYQLASSGLLQSVNFEHGKLGVLSCPAARDFDADPSWLGYMPHYGYNFFINPPVSSTPDARSFTGRRSKMTKDSERKILLVDSKHLDFPRGWFGVANVNWVDLRHGKGREANVAFLAGNVERVTPPARKPGTADDLSHPFSEAAFARSAR